MFRFQSEFTYFIVTHLGYDKCDELSFQILPLHGVIKRISNSSDGELTIAVKYPLGLQMA